MSGANEGLCRYATPQSVAAPIGRFSHLAITGPDASLVFVSGQIGMRPGGAIAGGMFDQTIQTFANIETLLAEIGALPRQIVKMTTYLVGPDEFAQFAAARAEVYQRWFPDGLYPAHTAATVAALAAPDLLVEIDAIVAVSK